jgi:hypothetical protein
MPLCCHERSCNRKLVWYRVAAVCVKYRTIVFVVWSSSDTIDQDFVTFSHCVRFTNILSQPNTQAAYTPHGVTHFDAWPPCSCDTMLQFLRIAVTVCPQPNIYVLPAWPAVEIIIIILGVALSYVYCPLLIVICHFLSAKRLSSIIDLINATYEVLTTVTMKRIFWDVMACSVVEIRRRFGGACCLHL